MSTNKIKVDGERPVNERGRKLETFKSFQCCRQLLILETSFLPFCQFHFTFNRDSHKHHTVFVSLYAKWSHYLVTCFICLMIVIFRSTAERQLRQRLAFVSGCRDYFVKRLKKQLYVIATYLRTWYCCNILFVCMLLSDTTRYETSQ